MQTEANWPLLTVSKGFFEGIKAVRGGAGPGLPLVQAAPSALAMGDDAMDESAGAGWDDDDEAGFGDEEGEKFQDAEADEDGEGDYSISLNILSLVLVESNFIPLLELDSLCIFLPSFRS